GLVEELQEIGVKLAIDDFGTGYSSLNAVKNIQIDTLKIDKSLVDEVLGSDRSMAILATIIELGKNLGADVVVEGLET
ncbi:EAL domain-containing protein, partial [Bacillus sp. SIMBA_161]